MRILDRLLVRPIRVGMLVGAIVFVALAEMGIW